jgi:hypothetical protein
MNCDARISKAADFRIEAYPFDADTLQTSRHGPQVVRATNAEAYASIRKRRGNRLTGQGQGFLASPLEAGVPGGGSAALAAGAPGAVNGGGAVAESVARLGIGID